MSCFYALLYMSCFYALLPAWMYNNGLGLFPTDDRGIYSYFLCLSQYVTALTSAPKHTWPWRFQVPTNKLKTRCWGVGLALDASVELFGFECKTSLRE